MKKIALLGSTGSIGTQTLEVIRTHKDEFSVCAMSCGRNIDLFREQLKEFRPAYAAVAGEKDALELSHEFPGISFGFGIDGICTAGAGSGADMAVNALLGMLGIQPTLEAIKAGKDIAFANKETLVAGGALIMDAVKAHGVNFLPVDSEHSAIFQSLQGSRREELRSIILTASGGPFRGYRKDQLENVTLAQALKHPNWSMGAKITVDSATMMNKGLEVIEASWLFSVPPLDIRVVVHPQSVLHSAVEFRDGCVIGQMGLPDMKMPIAYALSYPDRLPNVGEQLSLMKYGTLTFEAPDLDTFRCLALAYRAIREGGSYPIVLNAANEEAVAQFLSGKIGFADIARRVEAALDAHENVNVSSVADILEIERKTREYVCRY